MVERWWGMVMKLKKGTSTVFYLWVRRIFAGAYVGRTPPPPMLGDSV